MKGQARFVAIFSRSGVGRDQSRRSVLRASSPSVDGSGAPSHRGRLSLLGLAALVFALLTLGGSAFANHVVVDYFGNDDGTGALGGELNKPREVVVNNAGNGPADAGDVYVVDEQNHRIQRFSSDGDFEFAIGRDVIALGEAGDLGDVFEKCVIAARCKAGNPGGAGGEVDNPYGIAPDEDTGHIYVSGRDNRRIQQFDGDGGFIRTWGFDVIVSGQPNDAGTGYEVCDTTAVTPNAASDCQAGDSGSGLGQYGSGTSATDSLYGLAVSPPDGSAATGKVYLANSVNRRVETYDLDGANPANFGSSAVFATSQPRRLAVDSRGIVYASNTTGGGRIERYDSLDANGGGTVFLAPIGVPPLLQNNAFAARATSGLAVDPDSDGAGPDEDVLYVLRHGQSGGLGVQQFGPANDPGLTTPPTAADEQHGDGSLGTSASNPNVYGLALDQSANRLYVSSDFDGDHRVYVFDDDPLPLPTFDVDPVTLKTDTTATITGTVDPMGGVGIECELEYDTDPDLDSSTVLPVPDCDGLDPDGGAQPFARQIAGLDPNTTYYFRFTATRAFDSTSTQTTTTGFFTTVAPPPVTSSVGAVQIEDVCVRLVATIDPRNTEAGYFFEYGTTPALGQSTSPLAIGGGTTPITVSRLVCGLTPDQTYYLRVVATNLSGTTQSPSTIFHTRALPLPGAENRGYEMVTPIDKNYTDIDQGAARNAVLIAPRGDALAICSQALFGEDRPRMTLNCAPYLTRRTGEGPTGWQTTNPFPDYCAIDPDSGDNANLFAFPSPDLSRFAVQRPESASCPFAPLDLAAPLIAGGQSRNLYLQDTLAAPPTHRLMNPLNASTSGSRLVVFGGSEDFGHVLYQSYENQTPATPAGDSPPAGDFRKLYEFVREGADCGPGDPGHDASLAGCLRLVTVSPADTPFATPSAVPTLSTFAGQAFTVDGVSSDGSRIFFQNPHTTGIYRPFTCDNPGCQVYMREDGATTFDVSGSECTAGDCGAPQSKADVFIAATPSGAEAFFVSCARLTDASSPQASCTAPWGQDSASAGSKLYRWDRDLSDGSRLVDLTADHEPFDGNQPNFRGLIGSSADGETAFFVASGQIVAGEPTGPGDKLYRWQWNGGDPAVDYLGPYQRTNGSFSGHDYNWSQQHPHVTPDGEHLLIYTELPISAGDSDSDVDAYRWSEDEGWICVSCQLPGAGSAGDVELEDRRPSELSSPAPNSILSEAGELSRRHLMSDDGRRIFFATPDALVPQDTNGEGGCPLDTIGVKRCMDIYVWHEGTVSLVSSGTGDEGARLITATPSGRDVFFYARERLVGWDLDDNVDIYNARVGGGFPEPPPVPPPCDLAAGACEGPASVPSDVPGAGSRAFVAPVTRPSPNTCGRFSKKAQRKRGAARKAARKGQAKRARALRKQARNLNRRAKRCNRRQGR